jgi:cytochrome c-type biogenesis protein CcmE
MKNRLVGDFWRHPRHAPMRRMAMIVGGLGIAALAAALILFGLRQNITFFVTPTMLVTPTSTPVTMNQTVRLGGYVQTGSLSIDRHQTPPRIAFEITDGAHRVAVHYTGPLPDLFREGQGVVAQGMYDSATKTFQATLILAKHDENYKPPELESMAPAAEKAAQIKTNSGSN